MKVDTGIQYPIEFFILKAKYKGMKIPQEATNPQIYAATKLRL